MSGERIPFPPSLSHFSGVTVAEAALNYRQGREEGRGGERGEERTPSCLLRLLLFPTPARRNRLGCSDKDDNDDRGEGGGGGGGGGSSNE